MSEPEWFIGWRVGLWSRALWNPEVSRAYEVEDLGLSMMVRSWQDEMPLIEMLLPAQKGRK